MNWDAAGAIGEVIGAGAVVVSVVYLALQIRRQTDQSRLEATRELANQFSEYTNRLVDDKEFVQLYLKAVAGYHCLPNEDRARIASFFHQIMRFNEQQYLHETNTNVDSSYFESIHSTFEEWLTFPGVQEWWDVSGNMFGAQFRQKVDADIVVAKKKGYSSSFKSERENAT
jgi:hypothetical protein